MVEEQVDLAREHAPWIDLGAECAGRGANPREFAGFVIEVEGEASEIVARHGITGLATGRQPRSAWTPRPE
jgi:hypothetical protein